MSRRLNVLFWVISTPILIFAGYQYWIYAQEKYYKFQLPFVTYYPNGSVYAEGGYLHGDGELDGEVTQYTEDGRTISHVYDEGRLKSGPGLKSEANDSLTTTIFQLGYRGMYCIISAKTSDTTQIWEFNARGNITRYADLMDAHPRTSYYDDHGHTIYSAEGWPDYKTGELTIKQVGSVYHYHRAMLRNEPNTLLIHTPLQALVPEMKPTVTVAGDSVSLSQDSLTYWTAELLPSADSFFQIGVQWQGIYRGNPITLSSEFRIPLVQEGAIPMQKLLNRLSPSNVETFKSELGSGSSEQEEPGKDIFFLWKGNGENRLVEYFHYEDQVQSTLRLYGEEITIPVKYSVNTKMQHPYFSGERLLMKMDWFTWQDQQYLCINGPSIADSLAPDPMIYYSLIALNEDRTPKEVYHFQSAFGDLKNFGDGNGDGALDLIQFTPTGEPNQYAVQLVDVQRQASPDATKSLIVEHVGHESFIIHQIPGWYSDVSEDSFGKWVRSEE